MYQCLDNDIHDGVMGSQGIYNAWHAVQVCERGRDVGSIDNQRCEDVCM